VAALPARLRRLLLASSTRLVLMAFGFQLLLAGIVMAWVYGSAEREIDSREQALVVERRDDLLAAWRIGGAAELKALIDTQEPVPGEAVVLVDAAGAALAGNLPGLPAGLTVTADWQEATLAASGEAVGDYRLLLTRLDRAHVLLVGRAQLGGNALLNTVASALATSLLLTVPAALILALLLGRLANARVAAIAQVAGDVAGGNLGRRVARGGGEDAYDRLGDAINAMLDRIEGLVVELRTVTDGLAHDLRSPLTRLRGHVEQAQAHGSANGATLDAMAGDLDRLLVMLTTALQISRAEAGIGRDHMAPVALADLIETTAEIYGPIAEDMGVQLDARLAPSGSALLHRALIQQALGNLIENGLRHAMGATRITLSATRTTTGIELIVADNGPGIPSTQHALALSRFGRLDPARGGSGTGLGLSLVQAVARLHGGDVSLMDAEPGLKVAMHLPQPDQAPVVPAIYPAWPAPA
jgi:signal transduction histidine kinase